MSGREYLLDTSAIIQLFKGNAELVSLLESADFISTSIIAEMEYYSFSGLSEHDALLFRAFKTKVMVYGIPAENDSFIRLAVDARRIFKLKLPDAILAATARANGLTIITADDHFRPLGEPWRVRFYNPI